MQSKVVIFLIIINDIIVNVDFSFIQFYLDSSHPIISQDPSYLFVEYSVNGGIEWTMFEVIPLDGTPIAKLFQVSLPSRALSPATRIKWSHLGGENSQQLVVWTIDEVMRQLFC